MARRNSFGSFLAFPVAPLLFTTELPITGTSGRLSSSAGPAGRAGAAASAIFFGSVGGGTRLSLLAEGLGVIVGVLFAGVLLFAICGGFSCLLLSMASVRPRRFPSFAYWPSICDILAR